jgi:hypothetical protein
LLDYRSGFISRWIFGGLHMSRRGKPTARIIDLPWLLAKVRAAPPAAELFFGSSGRGEDELLPTAIILAPCPG